MTFLEAVNEIFRRNGIIRGDTDTITTFSDTAHNASTQIAILSVQDELADLISDRLIDNEQTSSSITLVSGTRTYALAADFVRFSNIGFFFNSSQGRQVYEYPGGKDALEIQIYNYQTQTGSFNWWYWEPGTSNKVGVFQVPGAAEDTQVWTYEYEKSVQVSTVSDTLPFHTDDQSRAFLGMASRRFKFMFEDVKNASDIQAILNNDVSYRTAKTRLMNLVRPTYPNKAYGSVYR